MPRRLQTKGCDPGHLGSLIQSLTNGTAAKCDSYRNSVSVTQKTTPTEVGTSKAPSRPHVFPIEVTTAKKVPTDVDSDTVHSTP